MKPNYKEVSSFTYAKTYNWYVKIEIPSTVDYSSLAANLIGGFTSVQKKFKDICKSYLPVKKVDIKNVNIEEHRITAGHRKFYFPKSIDAGDISITFYDDDYLTLIRFFRAWVNHKINNKGSGTIGVLSDIVLYLSIIHFDDKGEEEFTIDDSESDKYVVYPKNLLGFSGDNSNMGGEALTSTLTFRIAGFKKGRI